LQFKQFLEASPNHLDAQNRLACCLRTTKRPLMALAAYRRAEKLAPGHPDLLAGMAGCYKDLGNFDKAISYYKRALKTESGKIEALYNLALLIDYPFSAPPVREMQRLHDTLSVADPARVLVCFALGRVYEGNGRHQEAFLFYEEGNRLHFPRVAYDERTWFANYDAIQGFFSVDLFARLENLGCPDTTPIFILGMPRSGSTLVEQILASHSAVYGGDELDIMPRIAESVIPRMAGLPYPMAINTMGREAFAQVTGLFLRELRSYCPNNKPRITVKTLHNYLHVGLIRLLFPRAAIIHCTRDPMDTCWSMYRQHFSGNIPYCYDQTALGRYYCRYRQLMRHWHAVLPGHIHDVAYEELVQEPEATIRLLLGHCGLPFERSCLTFYRTRRAVSTASSRQVRRPIYTSSVKSWEPVAEKLNPLRTALQPCYQDTGSVLASK
jgi:hypothetical protein